ncbi:odorant receptor 46a-like [Ptiloglossa arizonensis]|uniref:odorant receptor 46a-like n=1 Tax=Ptiloglossa arizonensis TaxID=3350558 RepID=UPI003F9ECB34
MKIGVDFLDRKMTILRPAFAILTCCGCWRPCGWSSTSKRLLYGSYTVFVFLLLHTFCASQFLNVILNVKTADELSDSVYMFIATCLSCCKIVVLLTNRRNVMILKSKLEEEPCKPMDDTEATIQKRFDKRIGSFTIYYTIMVEVTVFCMILSSLFTDFRNGRLTYRAWLPFHTTDQNLYYVAYSHQIVGLIATSLMNVACDVTMIGLFVHASSQQEILKYRLKRITRETRTELGQVVSFHNFQYRYVFALQEKFKAMLGIQLLSSTLVVCFIMYQLVNTPPTSPKFFEFVMYMICMTTQIFIYCWYGNQLKLKSVEIVGTISELDWWNFDNSSKKALIMIMRRAMKPIEFTSAYVVTIDLNTFVRILKMSYSTYNLLQRTKES